MSTFEDFLLHCTGADNNCVKDATRSDVVKLTSIGKSIIITTFFSSISFFYAIFVITHNYIISSILCLVWGAFIYNIDRYIVSSMMGVDDKFEEFKLFIPRFVIAILISLTIAVPIELLIFEDEINESLNTKQVEQIEKGTKNTINQREADLKKLMLAKEGWNTELSSLNGENSECLRTTSSYKEKFDCEMDGNCGTGKIGKGAIAIEKEKSYLSKKRECLVIRGRNDKKISIIVEKISENENSIKQTKNDSSVDIKNIKDNIISNLSDSLLVRITTLRDLTDKDKTVYISVLMVTLLILSMELMPLLIKILSKNGAYEDCLSCLKNKKISDLRKKRVEMSEEILSISREIEKISEIAKKQGEEFSSKLREKINLIKNETYYNLFNDKLSKVSKRKDVAKEIEEHIREDIIQQTLNVNKRKKTRNNRALNFKINVSYKQVVFISMSVIVFAASVFIYKKTNNINAIKYFILLLILMFNTFVFYKKLASNKLEQAPSSGGV